MKSLKSSRRSSPNSRTSDKPNQANVPLTTDSYRLPHYQQRNNLNEIEAISKTINIKPLSKVAKATSKLNFFKSRIKQNENQAKKDEDLLQVALNSFKKHDKSKSFRRETISSCTDEQSGPVSRLHGIIKPRKFGETFRITRSGKESVLRPSSDSVCHKMVSAEDSYISRDNIPWSECSSLKIYSNSQKLKFGTQFNKKSHKTDDEKVENKSNLIPSKQENFISNSVDCVPWRLERNRTFVKEDFEATGLPIVNKESGLFRTYSEDCCEKTYLEDSPSLSSRASSFGILNDSYLLEQTLGGELVKGDAFDDLIQSAEQMTRQRLRHNTFVIRDHSKDKVLSLSSLMPAHDSPQKIVSGMFVTKSTNNICNSTLTNKLEEIVSKDCTDEMSSRRDGDFAFEESKRPVSLFSTSSTDVGIIADYGVDSVDLQLIGKAANIRPISIISTSSVDTGYQPDSDVENCRIPTIASSRPPVASTNLDVHLTSSSSTNRSSSLIPTRMTDLNNNGDDIIDTTSLPTLVPPSIKKDVTTSAGGDDAHPMSLDEESNIKNEAMEKFVEDDKEVEAECKVDDDDDEDDYLILSNSSTLYTSTGLEHGSFYITSTPDKNGQKIITEERDVRFKPFVCNEPSSSLISVVHCHGSGEDKITPDDVTAATIDSKVDSMFALHHPMELSCIVEADNEVIQPVHHLLNDAVDVLRGLRTTDLTLEPPDIPRVDSKLMKATEEVNATGVIEPTPMVKESSDDHESDHGCYGNDDCSSGSCGMVGETIGNFRSEVETGQEGRCEVGDAVRTVHDDRSDSSSHPSSSPHKPDTTCLRGVSVEGVCGVIVAGDSCDGGIQINTVSTFPLLKAEESVGNNSGGGDDNDTIGLPEDKGLTAKSSPDGKSPQKINFEKSSAVRKPVDQTQTTKCTSNKTVRKSEKVQKLSGSQSTTPKNTSRTSQSSSSIQSRSKPSEPFARKNSVPKKHPLPKLQTNLVGCSTKAQSANHLVDGRLVGKTPASSNSSSPKVDSKELSPAGSDGKLENVAGQAGKKVVQKNIFQSSTDLKSRGSGDTKAVVKPQKKFIPVKRSSVVQEPGKTSVGVVKRLSVNIPYFSSAKQKLGSVPSNSPNVMVSALTNGRLAAKKPIFPSKSPPKNNDVDGKATKNSLHKSVNNLDQSSCHDNLLEAKYDLQMKKVKFDLYKTTRAVEALSVVIKYFESQADKKNNSLLSATKKLHHASSSLASLKEQLCVATRQRDGLLAEVKRSDERYKREMKELTDSMNAERVMMEKEVANKLESEINKLSKQHMETTVALKCNHKNEVELLAENNKRLLREKDEKSEEIKLINEQQEKKMRSTSIEHKHQLDDLTFRFEQMKMTLLEKVEVLRSECDDLRHRESTFMESCQREAEVHVQSCLSRYKQLPQEIESLKAVMELRNKEVHELRALNLQQQKEHEELEESQRTNHFLKQKIENLEAIVDMRGDYEKQLTEKYQLLVRRLEKESKINKRLSMDNEELQWKLSSTSQLQNPSLSIHQFPPAMSSSYTSGVTSLDRKFCKGDRRPLSVDETTKLASPSTPTSGSEVSRQCDVFESPRQPSSPSYLSFSPPRHQSSRSARISSKGLKHGTTATPSLNSRAVHNKVGSLSVCASGDGNKLQRSGTYNLKDMERDDS